MKKIAVLTSGGDAPGMNPAINAIVRTAANKGLQTIGIRRGYAGLLNNEFVDLDISSVDGIINQGGTMLLTARSSEFRKAEYQERAVENLQEHGIEGLIVIGGDGSLRGALELSKRGVEVVGIPATIDNDIAMTDFSIGFDTAVNTALDGIRKLRDTASSHERVFVVEVMGRESGDIALTAGIAVGAEVIVVPEVDINHNQIIETLDKCKDRGQSSSIVIVAEGASSGYELGKVLEAKTDQSVRVLILGHLQRGGSPTVKDSILASMMGCKSVSFLMEGSTGTMTTVQNNEILPVRIEEALSKRSAVSSDLQLLSTLLS